MRIFERVGFAAACVALIVAVGSVGSAIAQQPPAAEPMRPQAQPGLAMGSEMMQRGMDRGRIG